MSDKPAANQATLHASGFGSSTARTQNNPNTPGDKLPKATTATRRVLPIAGRGTRSATNAEATAAHPAMSTHLSPTIEDSNIDPDEDGNAIDDDDTGMFKNDWDHSIDYLEERLLLAPNQDIDLTTITSAIIQVAHLTAPKKLPIQIKNALLAIAVLLRQINLVETAAPLASELAEQMTPYYDTQLQTLDTAAEAMVQQMQEALEQSTTKMIAKITETAASYSKATTEIQNMANAINNTTTELNATTKTYKEALKSKPSGNSPGPLMADPRAIAREGIRARQILIDTPRAGGASKHKGSSNTTILEIANDIIKTMPGGDGKKIQTVNKLANGGLLMELDSQESATWLRQNDTRTRFIALFDDKATIRERHFNIIGSFIPFTSKADTEAGLREIESVNNIPAQTITRGKFVKPEYKRRKDQQVGHAIFSFTTPEQANAAIVSGLYISQTRIDLQRCKKEPIRCLKCQGWNHVAAECVFGHDTCATCGKDHRQSTCTVKDSAAMYCTPCKQHGHASSDRFCPTFQQKCKDYDARNPENCLPYFPTEDAWTRVTQPPAVPHYRPTKDTSWTVAGKQRKTTTLTERPRLRQDTLDATLVGTGTRTTAPGTASQPSTAPGTNASAATPTATQSSTSPDPSTLTQRSPLNPTDLAAASRGTDPNRFSTLANE